MYAPASQWLLFQCRRSANGLGPLFTAITYPAECTSARESRRPECPLPPMKSDRIIQLPRQGRSSIAGWPPGRSSHGRHSGSSGMRGARH